MVAHRTLNPLVLGSNPRSPIDSKRGAKLCKAHANSTLYFMLKAILFDLDGTLTNTDPVHFRVWQDLLAPYGYEVDHVFFQTRISGRLNVDIVQDLLPQMSASEGEDFSEHKEARFRDMAASVLQPIAGLSSMLDWIAQRQIKSAVVTNAPRANAEFMLKALGLSETFDHLIIGSELARGKPDPLPYQEALTRFQIAPSEAVVFEDSPTGIRSALAAGITTVALSTTHTPESLQALGVKLVVNHFADEQLLLLGLLC
jgi:HAD superfamily hydrolase (TIGR01509 family)